MRLHRLDISGFKRLKKLTIEFGDATFLIGPNNSGKSSALQAIGYLLSDTKQLDQACFYSEADDSGAVVVNCDTVVLEAEIRDVPIDAQFWRGFKGRVFSYDPGETGETGKRLFYRKTFPLGKAVVVEIKSLSRTIKPEFAAAKTAQELLDAGADLAAVEEQFPDPTVKLNAKEKERLELIDDLWDISSEEIWHRNPGGIAGVVLSRLPNFLLIPAESSCSDIEKSNGPLMQTLQELFSDVRAESQNYATAQDCLEKLAKELDPDDEDSEFGKMMAELNKVLGGVFSEAQLHATASLSGPEALKPAFTVEMSSNIRTSSAHQGTGMVRAAVFGLLRFRQHWLRKRAGTEHRSLIIGFEEPEIYLHPSAANQMRDMIYELSGDRSQIIATTHSPYLIDLSRKPRQVLNRFYFGDGASESYAFSVTEKYRGLQSDDKNHIKMLLKLDDHVARIFFTKKVIIVEGDTEEVVLREAIRRLPSDRRHKLISSTEVIRARGKSTIISLCRYLNALGVSYFVIHDRDADVEGAARFNPLIASAAGGPDKVLQLQECMEDLLGYPPPSSEKPFQAFKHCSTWGPDWESVPAGVRSLVELAFSPYTIS